MTSGPTNDSGRPLGSLADEEILSKIMDYQGCMNTHCPHSEDGHFSGGIPSRLCLENIFSVFYYQHDDKVYSKVCEFLCSCIPQLCIEDFFRDFKVTLCCPSGV